MCLCWPLTYVYHLDLKHEHTQRMAERSFSESEPAATSSEAPALHRNRLDVRGPEVKVRVNIGSDFGLLSHAYEFRVHDMAQWLDRWDVDAVKKMLKPISTSDWISDSVVDTSRWSFGFQHTSAGNRCRMMHSFKRLPPGITSTEDKNIGILCSDWRMVALWKIVEIGRYEGVLCVSSDRRPSRPEDQTPDLLPMTEKRCAMAMAYLLWHLIIASVRRTRSLHTVRQVCTFH